MGLKTSTSFSYLQDFCKPRSSCVVIETNCFIQGFDLGTLQTFILEKSLVRIFTSMVLSNAAYVHKFTRCKHAPPRGALVQYLFWKKVWYVFLFQWYFQIRCMYINVWSYGNSCFQYTWSPPVLGCEGASRTKVYSCLG